MERYVYKNEYEGHPKSYTEYLLSCCSTSTDPTFIAKVVKAAKKYNLDVKDAMRQFEKTCKMRGIHPSYINKF